MKKTALTIAGSDCSGGAGVQADIKTMEANGVYAMSVISVLTAQNTLGVQKLFPVSAECITAQIDSVFADIFPDAVKIGMPGTTELIQIIAERLRHYQAKHIVVDPVMLSSSGSTLVDEKAAEMMKKELFPLAEVLTPNIPEAEVLTGKKIQTREEMEQAAEQLSREYGTAIVLKGGHAKTDANDLLYENGKSIWIEGERMVNPNTHGTGCTFSSAIAAGVAEDWDLETSVRRAKAYMQRAIGAGLDLGQGNGPLEHMVW